MRRMHGSSTVRISGESHRALLKASARLRVPAGALVDALVRRDLKALVGDLSAPVRIVPTEVTHAPARESRAAVNTESGGGDSAGRKRGR